MGRVYCSWKKAHASLKRRRTSKFLPKLPLVCLLCLLRTKIAEDTVTIVSIVPAQSNPHVFEPLLSKSRYQTPSFGSAHEALKKNLKFLIERNPSLTVVTLLHTFPKKKKIAISGLAKTGSRKAKSLLNHWFSCFRTSKNVRVNLINCSRVTRVRCWDFTTASSFQKWSYPHISPAFEFFCRDYGLIQLSIECDGKDPATRFRENLRAR